MEMHARRVLIVMALTFALLSVGGAAVGELGQCLMWGAATFAALCTYALAARQTSPRRLRVVLSMAMLVLSISWAAAVAWDGGVLVILGHHHDHFGMDYSAGASPETGLAGGVVVTTLGCLLALVLLAVSVVQVPRARGRRRMLVVSSAVGGATAAAIVNLLRHVGPDDIALPVVLWPGLAVLAGAAGLMVVTGVRRQPSTMLLCGVALLLAWAGVTVYVVADAWAAWALWREASAGPGVAVSTAVMTSESGLAGVVPAATSALALGGATLLVLGLAQPSAGSGLQADVDGQGQ